MMLSLFSVSEAIVEVVGPDGSFLRALLRGEAVVSSKFDVTSTKPLLTGSGVGEGRLESELRSEDRSTGELAREFEGVVLVDLERVERRVGSGSKSCAVVVADFTGLTSSSITSTTWPFGATTS